MGVVVTAGKETSSFLFHLASLVSPIPQNAYCLFAENLIRPTGLAEPVLTEYIILMISPLSVLFEQYEFNVCILRS